MNTTNNGPKQFLYVVRHQREVETGADIDNYLLLADRDPTVEELVSLFEMKYDEMHDELEVHRHDLDALPKLPPKGWGSV